MKRAISVDVRTRLFPYLLAITVACLLALVAWAVLQAFLGSDDVIVIDVAPLGAPDRLRVQVEGAVANPGVYDVPDGATVSDTVVMAGGLTDGGQLDAGMAGAAVADGELIVIPSGDTPASESTGPININTATAEELDSLPGIGPVIAERIIEHREASGGFSSIEELADVSGISERMVDEMNHLIVVETN